MPNDNSTMGERLEEKLGNNTFIWDEIPSEKGSGVPNPRLIELIQSEIQRAVGEERENFLGMVIRNCYGFIERDGYKAWNLDLESLESDLKSLTTKQS